MVLPHKLGQPYSRVKCDSHSRINEVAHHALLVSPEELRSRMQHEKPAVLAQQVHKRQGVEGRFLRLLDNQKGKSRSTCVTGNAGRSDSQ